MGETAVNSKGYKIEVSGTLADEKYNFVIKISPESGKQLLFRGFLSEEFVEDEIDNRKNLDYLEKLTLKVAVDRLADILKLPPNTQVKNVNWWFKNAQRATDS